MWGGEGARFRFRGRVMHDHRGDALTSDWMFASSLDFFFCRFGQAAKRNTGGYHIYVAGKLSIEVRNVYCGTFLVRSDRGRC